MFKKTRPEIIIVGVCWLFIFIAIFATSSKPHATFCINSVYRDRDADWYSVDYTISANVALDFSISPDKGDAPSGRGRVFPESCVTGTIGFGPCFNESLDTSEVQIENWLLIEQNKKYQVHPGEEIQLWKTETRNGETSTTSFHVKNR